MQESAIEVGDIVYAGETDVEGEVTAIWEGAARLKITRGVSAITDYYLTDLTLLKKG